MAIGQRIKYFRNRIGMTQKQLGEKLGFKGGSVSAGLAIYDTMQYIKCDVSTICMGLAASMASVLLCGGANGKRIILPNAQVKIGRAHV